MSMGETEIEFPWDIRTRMRVASPLVWAAWCVLVDRHVRVTACSFRFCATISSRHTRSPWGALCPRAAAFPDVSDERTPPDRSGISSNRHCRASGGQRPVPVGGLGVPCVWNRWRSCALLSADVFESVLGGPRWLVADDPAARGEPALLVSAAGSLGEGAVAGNGRDAYEPVGEPPVAWALGLPSAGDYEYVIITNNALESSFEPLLAQKQRRGLTGQIVTTEYVYANYGGTETGDNQDKIRQFIADAHANWGTQWVLLGGDVEIVPFRGVYASNAGVVLSNLPTDMYYACLDGPWNSDGDGIWGESTDGVGGGEIDLLPDVHVGRAPASNVTEATNFVNKTILYETTPHPNYDTAIWLGEKVDTNTWGDYSSMEIRDKTLPGNWNLIEHYESYGPWTGTQLRDELNASPHLVNNLGHSSPSTDSKISTSTVAGLTNAFPYFIYSQGCDAGSFDTADVSIAEKHVVAEHGAFGAVMNSRSGWYMPGTQPGASHYYALEFWDAVFNEGKVHLGEANSDSKVDNISLVAGSGYYRWIHMETNLFGDPETPLQLNGRPPATVNEIRGRVWNDLDGDGTADAGEPSLAGQVVYVDQNGNGVRDAQVDVFGSTNVPVAIPNPGTVTSTLLVNGGAATISDVNVTLNVTHPYDGDLEVFLISPSGMRVTLFRRVPGVNFSGTVLDDEASTSIFGGTAPYTGRFRPHEPLDMFTGDNPNGTWTLEITDTYHLDAGILNSWSLEISYVEPSATTDAQGNYVLPEVAGGSITVRHELPSGWTYTAPASGVYQVTLQGGEVADCAFGIREAVGGGSAAGGRGRRARGGGRGHFDGLGGRRDEPAYERYRSRPAGGYADGDHDAGDQREPRDADPQCKWHVQLHARRQ